MTKTSPLPGSSLDTDNYWHDKLRAIRWDEDNQNWMISTSKGFAQLKDFSSNPVIIPSDKSPAVSPMGVNVFYEKPREYGSSGLLAESIVGNPMREMLYFS